MYIVFITNHYKETIVKKMCKTEFPENKQIPVLRSRDQISISLDFHTSSNKITLAFILVKPF